MGGVARGFLSVKLIDKANKLSKWEGQNKQEQGAGRGSLPDRTRAGEGHPTLLPPGDALCARENEFIKFRP